MYQIIGFEIGIFQVSYLLRMHWVDFIITPDFTVHGGLSLQNGFIVYASQIYFLVYVQHIVSVKILL